MPKTKSSEKISPRAAAKPADELEKIVEIDAEEKLLDDDLLPGEIADEEIDEDEDAVLDEEEVDPFKDKWEE